MSSALTRGVCVVIVATLAIVVSQPAFGQLTKTDIDALRAQGVREGWTFEVGENDATQYPLEQLCGLVEPPDWRDGLKIEHPTVSRLLPSSFDWRTATDPNHPIGVTPIRNQGGCGSCWAFSAIGAMECRIKLVDHMDVDLAEQWLVSCTGAGTCSGGWHTAALNYLKCDGLLDTCGASGAVLEQHFPYVAWNAPCGCPYPHPYCLAGWQAIGDSVSEIKQAIYERGPISCCVYVTSAFQAYKSGVFNNCSSGSLNHAVVLVGWNDSQQYWIMRNSWGTGWGESGYMRIRYGCSMIGYAPVYVTYTPTDCNLNGVSDRRECALGDTPDCNGNFVPDSCEIADGSQTDCNGNTRPDSCDIALGASLDCNHNGLPDECELAAYDCDQNGIPDDCDIYEGRQKDCDVNGVPDACEIAGGAATDCNGNGIPDGCDLSPAFHANTVRLTPLGYGHNLTFALGSARSALTNVELNFVACGDLNYSNECVDVYLNDMCVGHVFTGTYSDCVEDQRDQLLVPPATFNTAARSGSVTITLAPSAGVNPTQCASSYLWMSIDYTAAPASRDCNLNAVPDECDIVAGRSADANADGIPDECPALGCTGDANCDGAVSWRDIDFFVAAMGDNYAAWAAHFTGAPPCDFHGSCDTNSDGVITWRDINPFVAAMGQTCAD